MASRPARPWSWVKRLLLVLTAVVLFLIPVLPAPASASTNDVVVTAGVFLNPLEVTAWSVSSTRVGTVFPVVAIVRNRGEMSLYDAVATIHLPKGVELAASKTEISLGTIRANSYGAAIWLVRSRNRGNYAILVSASGTYAGTSVTGQHVTLVAVTGR